MTALLLIASCGGGGPSQGDVALSIADAVVIPALDHAASAAAHLADSADAYCTDPSPAMLETVRTAWSEARVAWKRTEPMSFGPRSMSRAASQIDYTDTDPDAVDDLVAGGDIPDPAEVGTTLSSKVRGLGAIEHLLFGPGDPAQPDRCALLVALSAAVEQGTAEVAAGWSETQGVDPSYRDVFLGETGAMTGRDAVGETVEATVFTLRAMSTFGVGRAIGATSPEPDPAAVQEGAAGEGGADLAARVAGISDLYLGVGTDPGLSALVAARSAEVDEAIRADLARLPDLIAAVGAPFRDGLATDRAAAEELLAALDGLRVTFETDVVSLLDVVIGFSDTDGDTG